MNEIKFSAVHPVCLSNDAERQQATRTLLLQVLDRFSFGDSTILSTLRGNARILAFNYWFTYCVLKHKKRRFQALDTPEPAT